MHDIDKQLGISNEVLGLRNKVKWFIDEKVIPVESIVEEWDE